MSVQSKVQVHDRDWLNNIRGTLARIADKEYQRASWLGRGAEASSPIELYCQLMDDWMFDEFISRYLNDMTREQREAAFALARAMEAAEVDSGSDPKTVLENPKWQATRDAAKSFLDVFGPET